MQNIRSLAFFLILVVGGGIAIGIATAPGAWYVSLIKPPFNPPNWIFGPVWTALYICIAIAGWRVWLREPGGWAMKLWAAQLALNFIWSPVFFSAHRMDIALGIIILMLITIITFIVKARPKDDLAALLFLPYAAWVAFAAILNGSLLYLNTPISG
ncbi:TspO/MBR family protein [Roseibium aggregatum]|uniref:Tryptophan-rich sensory protein n=1 Tax=Roseibium aggregatum TaxID=187304 RepID=A0A926S4Q4_9HYPH|nr:TspO/MBR family protein [Roseibium aggregatum]MBD1546638.1 tryptophan-rich sensory protein [Roseibium aggregatum]